MGRSTKPTSGLLNLLLGQRDSDFEKALQCQDIDTEAPLKYELRELSFIEHTRVTKLTFIKIRTYRTIERTVQRDNQKYKIYSGWKQKESKVAPIVLKLTNNTLENLQDRLYLAQNDIVKNEDAINLVSQFAPDIVYKLATEYEGSCPMPSWFEKIVLQEECTQTVNKLKHEISNLKQEKRAAEARICELEQINQCAKNKIEKMTHRRDNKALFVVLAILTFGVYALLNSAKRLQKLTSQFTQTEPVNLQEIEKLKQYIDENIAYVNQQVKLIKENEESCAQKISEIQPLGDCLAFESDFVLLKQLAGMEYRKIVGVYVIRNRELNKVYVGQSKDVIKRLKSHFTGTVPKNIIFAEDYYGSKYENKDELFEFKIEELNTKDELDNRERQLIAEYGSFNTGYNGTSGNV